MKRSTCGLVVSLVALGLFVAGCERSAPLGGVEAVVKSEPGHEHDHSAGHDHAHAHGHDHEHGDPLYGGETVEIGHSHHASGETYYHAEVMPVAEGRITFHVLTETADGKSEPCEVAQTTITAYAGRPDRDASQAQEVAFSSDGEEGGATFAAPIPESLLDSERLFVVVPKIELGGEQLSFSFTATKPNEPAPSESGSASD